LIERLGSVRRDDRADPNGHEVEEPEKDNRAAEPSRVNRASSPAESKKECKEQQCYHSSQKNEPGRHVGIDRDRALNDQHGPKEKHNATKGSLLNTVHGALRLLHVDAHLELNDVTKLAFRQAPARPQGPPGAPRSNRPRSCRGADPARPSLFPSRTPDGNSVVPDAETSDFSARSRKARISAEAHSRTPHKGIRRLTPRLQESAASGQELAYELRGGNQVDAPAGDAGELAFEDAEGRAVEVADGDQ